MFPNCSCKFANACTFASQPILAEAKSSLNQNKKRHQADNLIVQETLKLCYERYKKMESIPAYLGLIITTLKNCFLFKLEKYMNGKLPRYKYVLYWHSMHIRTVGSQHQLSKVLNWLKLVYEPFRLSSMYRTFNFCPNQPGRNQAY